MFFCLERSTGPKNDEGRYNPQCRGVAALIILEFAMESKAAFDLLLSTLERMIPGRQGKVVGSALKIALRRAAPDFNEATLGYPSFANFLRAAPGISVSQGIHDVEVSFHDDPVGQASCRTHDPPSTIPIVRRDIWAAVTNTPDPPPVYDRRSSKVLRVVANKTPTPDEVDQVVAADAERYVPLPHLTFEEQDEIARKFLAEIEDPAKSAILSRVRDGTLSFARLYRTLLDTPAVLERWRLSRSIVVADLVRRWALRENVSNPDLVVDLPFRPLPKKSAAAPLEQQRQLDSDDAADLKQLIGLALDGMSLPELLEFRFPAHTVLQILRTRQHTGS